jgi:predicted secreted hydrolase
MDYRLRHRDGRPVAESNGSLVDAQGTVTPLALRDVDVQANGTWISPHTHAVYPSGWRLRIPRAGLDLTLTPTLRDQELASDEGGVSYWEGAVDVRDTANGRRFGVGYVELTGYAGALNF